MIKKPISRFLLCFLFLWAGLLISLPAIASNSQSSFGFVENRGQLRDDLGKPVSNAFFQASFPGMALFVTSEGLTCVFHQREESREEKEVPKSLLIGNREEGNRSKWRMDIQLVGGRISPSTLKGEILIPGHQNYFVAYASEGIYGVRSFEQVRISEVYPGIDWILKRDAEGRFKHEFEVAPGADASQIKLQYQGSEVEIGAGGKTLTLQTPLGNLEEGELKCYLKPSGTEVEAGFQVNGDLVSYQLSPYSENETLIIDPALELFWATRYGGGEIDGPTTMVVDKLFNLYVAGYTQSVNFPTFDPGGGVYYDPTLLSTTGAYKAYITKFSNSGVRLWATHYDRARFDDAIVDPNNNLYLSGSALDGFFTQNPGGGAYFEPAPNLGNGPGGDGGLVRFDPNGVLEWATFVGGSNPDQIYSMAFDGAGGILVSGNTSSSDFPLVNPGGGAYFSSTINGTSDIFITRFNASGAITWSTLIGGSSYDINIGLAKNSQNHIFLGARIGSTDFPTLDPGGGAFFQGTTPNTSETPVLVEFSPNNQLLYSTYIGGSDGDELNGLEIDLQDNIYLGGVTRSTDFPTFDPGGGAFYQGTYAGDYDAFYMKLSNTRQLEWGTYFGGSDSERTGPTFEKGRIALDLNGNLYFVGRTSSADYPVAPPDSCGTSWYQDTLSSCGNNITFGSFDPSGRLLWSTHHGCNTIESDIAIDFRGHLYIAGEYYFNIGYGPFVDPGGGAWYQTTGAGRDDMMILKFTGCNFVATEAAEPETQLISLLAPNPTSGRVVFQRLAEVGSSNAPLKIEIFNSQGQIVKQIDFGEVQTNEIQEFYVNSLAAGVYMVAFKLEDQIEVQRLQVVK